MNTLPPPPVPPSRADRELHTRRCARHVEREAAARCPDCARFFCRECVVEHDGRLLCADCLARAGHAPRPGRQRWPRIRKIAQLGGAVVLVWLAFYVMGSLLLKLPPALHEGTVRQTTDSDPS